MEGEFYGYFREQGQSVGVPGYLELLQRRLSQVAVYYGTARMMKSYCWRRIEHRFWWNYRHDRVDLCGLGG